MQFVVREVISMSLRFINSSIGRKLAAGFLIILALNIVAGLVGTLGVISIRDTVQKNFDQGVQIDDLSLRAQTALLFAEKNEKDFLVLYPTLGVAKAKSAYADQVPTAIDDLRN